MFFLVKTDKLKLRDAKDKEDYPWVGTARSTGPGLWCERDHAATGQTSQ